jgi:hypothetical protein
VELGWGFHHTAWRPASALRGGHSPFARGFDHFAHVTCALFL